VVQDQRIALRVSHFSLSLAIKIRAASSNSTSRKEIIHDEMRVYRELNVRDRFCGFINVSRIDRDS